jgi:lysine-N-methylase
MNIAKPIYFDTFRCIADLCPDSCCKEWEVDVDAASAAYYRSLQGPLGDRLRQVLKDTEDGTVMTISDGRCPMWRRDGLCRIQAELGHDALCRVCQDFPRLRHDYGDFVEYGLELSCPEAARLILTQPYRFTQEGHPGGDAPEYDLQTMSILRHTREAALAFLSSTSLPPNEALIVLLLYAHHVQNQIDGGETAVLDTEAFLSLARNHAYPADRELFLDFFRNLEILTPEWYQRLLSPATNPIWDPRQFALARYFIYRYWLQAVSDYDLIGRVKMLVAACLLTHLLGGDFLQTAQSFSKEIENDPDNLDAIWDGAYTSPALADFHLFGLLLNR